MVILYGTKNFKRQKGLSRNHVHCDHCGKDAKWQFVHMWTWFTLFYIPLFPVWRKQMLICPFCNWGIKIDSKNKAAIMPEIEVYGQAGTPPQVGTAPQQAIHTAPQQQPYTSAPQYGNTPQQPNHTAPQQQHTSAAQYGDTANAAQQPIHTASPQQQHTSAAQYGDTANAAQQPNLYTSRQPTGMQPYCSHCGKPLKEHARFCQYCGQAVPQGDPMPRQNPQAASKRAEPSPSSHADFMKNAQRMKICPSCHLLFPADKVECDICGSMLEDKK